MVYCDNNPNIIEWGSEEVIIPYRSPVDRKVHRYFPDFYIKYRNSKGDVLREIIEVKPKKQCFLQKNQNERQENINNKFLTSYNQPSKVQSLLVNTVKTEKWVFEFLPKTI